ncbi:MAG: hypothetical protein WC683_04845 [bacterium]
MPPILARLVCQACGACGLPIEGEAHYEPSYDRHFCHRCYMMDCLFMPSRKSGQQNLDGIQIGLVRKHPSHRHQARGFSHGKPGKTTARTSPAETI